MTEPISKTKTETKDRELFDVVIVSAFGRHNWLVEQLGVNEWQVGHVDVSTLLGRWPEDDLRNPFGLSKTVSLRAEQFAYWQKLSAAEQVKNGVSILFSSGPFEALGPLSHFYQTTKNIPNDVKVYMEHMPESASASLPRARAPKSTKFEDVWLLNLSQQLSSTMFSENISAGELDGGLPIFSELYRDHSDSEMRRPSNFFKKLEHVRNFEATQVSSLRKTPEGLFELSFASPESTSRPAGAQPQHAQKLAVDQRVRTRVLLWALSSGETEFVSREIARFLFSSSSLEAKWSWQRFSYKGPGDIVALWPIQFYMLEHLRLPWTHDNLCLISKKTDTKATSDGTFEVLMRIPSLFRFNAEYLSELSVQFKNRLNEKFLTDDFACVDLPVETKYGKEELGPPRWPVFTKQDRAKLKSRKDKYLIFDSCENLPTHQLQAQLELQEKLFRELTDMRKTWLAIEAKAAQKAINKEIRSRE